MLTDPGSHIEGPTEAVLAVVFETTWRLLRETMTDEKADNLALRHLGRVHEALAQHNYVIREVSRNE